MNRARTFGPDLASGKFTLDRLNVAGPLTGALIAVRVAFMLGAAGGGSAGSGAVQADPFTPGAAISGPVRRAFRGCLIGLRSARAGIRRRSGRSPLIWAASAGAPPPARGRLTRTSSRVTPVGGNE